MRNLTKLPFFLLLMIVLVCTSPLYAQDITIQKPNKQQTQSSNKKPSSSSSTKRTSPTKKTQSTTSQVTTHSKSVSNPQKNVVYKFSKNEILVNGESFLSFKADKEHFACIIVDTLTHKSSLVMDGEKKLTADEPSFCWNDFYIDASDYSKCIFTYINGNNEYIYIEGKTYGPYRNDIYYRHYLNYGGESDPSFVEKGIYYFRRWDEQANKWITNEYLYGEPINRKYESFDYSRKNNFSTDTIISVNQRYKVNSYGFSSVVINDTRVSVISPFRNSDYERRSTTILDDGRCVVEYWGDNFNERSIFIVAGGKVTELEKNEWFNYRTLSVDKRDITDNKCELVGSYWNQDIYSITSPNNHIIETSIMKNYVLIDNKEYGKGCAINLWYYKDINSFVWTALEGNELVMYKYKL